jgi:hypothetical protein
MLLVLTLNLLLSFCETRFRGKGDIVNISPPPPPPPMGTVPVPIFQTIIKKERYIFLTFPGETLTSGRGTASLNSMECDRVVEPCATSGPADTSHTTANTSAAGESSQELELECDLLLRLAGPVLSLDLHCQGGRTGKDGVHQLLQYLKNRQQRGAK